MCIGIPMQIISSDAQHAKCEHQGEMHLVDISLVGAQPADTWILVFLGAAREVMTPQAAKQTLDAVLAMQSIMSGDHDIEHLFADLVEREPQLPDFLKDSIATTKNSVSADD